MMGIAGVVKVAMAMKGIVAGAADHDDTWDCCRGGDGCHGDEGDCYRGGDGCHGDDGLRELVRSHTCRTSTHAITLDVRQHMQSHATHIIDGIPHSIVNGNQQCGCRLPHS
jgi:hypothetical protein